MRTRWVLRTRQHTQQTTPTVSPRRTKLSSWKLPRLHPRFHCLFFAMAKRYVSVRILFSINIALCTVFITTYCTTIIFQQTDWFLTCFIYSKQCTIISSTDLNPNSTVLIFTNCYLFSLYLSDYSECPKQEASGYPEVGRFRVGLCRLHARGYAAILPTSATLYSEFGATPWTLPEHWKGTFQSDSSNTFGFSALRQIFSILKQQRIWLIITILKLFYCSTQHYDNIL